MSLTKVYNRMMTTDTISDVSSTPSVEAGNTDGTLVNPGPSGDTTTDKVNITSSTNSLAKGVRAGVYNSIYSEASGNVSAVVASRLSLAQRNTSAVVASEEGRAQGRKGLILGSLRSTAVGTYGTHIASQDCWTTSGSAADSFGRQANIASANSVCGVGYGAEFSLTISGGVVTAITVDDGGQDYDAAETTFTIEDPIGGGTGATGTVTIAGGVITAAAVTNGGSGYSSDAFATATSSGVYSANIAQTGNAAVQGSTSANIAGTGGNVIDKDSARSATLAANECSITDCEQGVVIASIQADLESGANNSAIIASSGSILSGARSVLFGRNVELVENDYIGWGYSATGITSSGSNQNLTGFINKETGEIATGVSRPLADDTSSSGTASRRWSVVYAATGTINTSDENAKQDIRDISDAEKAVASVIKSQMKAFRFKDAHAQKGDDARIHFGVIAQDIAAAFAAEGLDPNRYGVFCSDTWTDEDGIEQTRLGVRYEELFAFIISTL